jgi:hypothetical protein
MMQPPESSPQPPSQPQPPPQPQAQPKPQPVGYEFSVPQDDVIRTLSGRMRFVGIFYVLASGLVGLAGLVMLFFAPLIGLFYLVLLTPELLIGIWTINAANSFRLVVDTRGHDIPHLMNALSSLRKLYTLMFWLLVVALVVMVLAIAAGIFMWSAGMLPIPTESSTYTSVRW